MPSFETLRVVLLGTGTPTPEPGRAKPSVALIAKGRPYIVDFGAGVVGRTVEGFHRGIHGLDILRLSRAFATHLHSDHTSGLSDLWLTPAAVGRLDTLKVYGPKGIRNMVDHLFKAYEEDLAVRTRGRSQDKRPAGYRIEAIEIAPGVVYEDPNVKVTAYPVSHGTWQHAFAYRFDAPGRAIVISGDTGPSDMIVSACNGCDVLVHEVYCEAGYKKGPPSFRHYHGTSHTSTRELADIAQRAKPKVLVLYHLLFFGCTEEMLLKEITDRYRGTVALGHDLDVF
jgi:ribonuclease Z